MNNQENKDKKLSKKAKTIITITSIGGVVLVVLTTIVSILLYQNWLYKKSVQALVNREFETAYIGFGMLRNYKDSPIKKEYAYELYNYESGYTNYEVMIDEIVKKNGEVIAQFDTNGASYIPDRVINEVSKDRYINESPQRVHYDFTGWDLTYGEYQKDKDAVRFTLTAGFETHQYPISYELNGGSIISSAPTHYSYFDGDIAIPRAQMAGYNFTGYYVNGDESEKILDYVIPSHSSGAVVLTANYEPKTIHIQFDPGEGTLDGPSEGDYIYGEPATLPNVIPPSYYEFDGWYLGKTKVDSESFNITENSTVTAHYLAEEYDIIYDLDGGTIDPDAPHTYSYDSDDIYIPFAKKEGHMFTGWIVEETDQGNINYTIPHHSHDDVHLKATYAEYEVETEDPKCVKSISSSRTITDLVFPKEVDTLSIDVVESGLNDLINIGVEKGHPHAYVEDGFLLHKTETGERTLMMMPKPTYLGAKSVTIPACDVIGPGVFANNNKIEHLETKSPLKKVKDEGFKNCPELVDISNASLVEVGKHSFDGDSDLEDDFLTNNPNLTRIDDFAFAQSHFDTIKLSSNITYVGKEAFLNGIPWEIIFDNAPSAYIADDAFKQIDHTLIVKCRVTNINRALTLLSAADITRVYVYGPGEFQSEMFKVNTTVQQIICEDTSFSSFEEEAFKDVESVKKIVLDGNLETIGESAFENSNVETIEFNDSSNMKYIGKNAFKNSKLKSIDLSMAEDLIIEEDAFLNCTKLEEIKVNYKTAAYLNAACRGCGLLRNITIKYTGGAIASGVIFKEAYFYDLNAVQYITFENNTEEVTPIHFGSKCFRNCEELIDIKLDGFQVASLDTYTFENCRSFKNSYHYFDNLEYYPVGAFFGCESVEVLLDDTLVIDKYAFVSCHCLGGEDDTVELNPNLERIGIEAFAYTSPDLKINTNKLESEVAELKGGPEDYSAYWYKWDMNFFGTILYKIEE